MKNYGLLIISLLFSAHVTLSAGAVFSAFANVPSVLTDNRFDMVLTNAPALASGGLVSAGSVNFKLGSTLNLSPGIARLSLDSSHVTLSAGAAFSAFANVDSLTGDFSGLTVNRSDMALANAPALASGGLISAGSVNFKPGSTLNLSPGIARPSLDSSLQPLIDIPVQELVKALNFLVEEKAPEDALYGTYPEASHMPEPVRSLSVLKILHLINYHTSAP